MDVKGSIRKLFRHCGLDVRRFMPGSSQDAALMVALSQHSVDLVLDVGANTGQFAQRLREIGYRGRIVSFEPLSAAHSKLLTAARGDKLWDVAERMAIGDKIGEVEIHVAGNSVSSSALPMLESHLKAAPSSAYVRSEIAPARTLDVAGSQYMRPDAGLFLKIDTQGYEDKVLLGASRTLQRARGLQIELSLVPLYEGQRSYDEMIGDLGKLGFDLWNIAPAFVDSRNGRLLQIDATLFRGDASE